MKNLFFHFLFLISIISSGQKNDFIINIKESALGISLPDSNKIKGEKYIFPENIYKVHIDTLNNLLTVQLRKLKGKNWLANNGYVLQYSLDKKKLLWNQKIYYKTTKLLQKGDLMIFNKLDKSYRRESKTSKILWVTDCSVFHIDHCNKIGIGYKTKDSKVVSDKLKGIDLDSGKIAWTRDITNRCGWDDFFYLNDSTIIIVSEGLHSLNLKTGKGWDYNTITWKENKTLKTAEVVAGVAFGLMAGVFIYPMSNKNLVTGIASNVLADSSYFYFASKEQLAKIDKQTGEIVWKAVLPENAVSKSSIFANDSLIFMVNKGFAYGTRNTVRSGKPFIAAFNKKTGKRKYLAYIPEKYIYDFKSDGNKIYLLFKDKIAEHSLETGKKILEKNFRKEVYGYLKYFVGSQTYIKNSNDKFVSLSDSDSTKLYVYTDLKEILGLDSLLHITKKIYLKNLYRLNFAVNDYKFITKGNKTIVLNQENNPVAELYLTQNAFLINGKIYDVKNNTFKVVKLEEVVK